MNGKSRYQRKDHGTGRCLCCEKEFCKKHPGQKYCHWQCANKHNAAARKAELCKNCNVAIWPGSALCRKCKSQPHPVSPEPKKLVERVCEKRPVVRGNYVYVWFEANNPLPFYVGKGVENRAWDRHEREDGTAHWCQTLRVSCVGFRVEIVRDNLTPEGAALLEATLIAFVKQCGGTLANQTGPMRRQENLPLTLEDAAAVTCGG